MWLIQIEKVMYWGCLFTLQKNLTEAMLHPSMISEDTNKQINSKGQKKNYRETRNFFFIIKTIHARHYYGTPSLPHIITLRIYHVNLSRYYNVKLSKFTFSSVFVITCFVTFSVQYIS